MQGNKEHMYIITQPEVVTKQMGDFEAIWKEATPLAEGQMQDLAREYAQRKREKEQKENEKASGRSRSKSVQREPAPGALRALGDAAEVTAPSLECTW